MPPSYTITVLHKAEIPYTAPRQIIHQTLHRGPLQQKLQRDNQWTEQQFNLVDWKAYHRAILKHPRSHRISLTKLSHGLWNTNMQNHQFYGEIPSCPACKQHPEDFTHVLTCQQPEAVEARTAAMTVFHNTMKKVTPSSLFDSLLSGINQWLASPSLSQYLPPTAGSLLPQLQGLTAAFQAQSSIGWSGLF
jgi:hypothetical protein